MPPYFVAAALIIRAERHATNNYATPYSLVTIQMVSFSSRYLLTFHLITMLSFPSFYIDVSRAAYADYTPSLQH